MKFDFQTATRIAVPRPNAKKTPVMSETTEILSMTNSWATIPTQSTIVTQG
jgi:hypothetical protein